MSECQDAIRSVCKNGYIKYVYACYGCGKELDCYAKKRIRGHAWCGKCIKERQNENFRKTEQKKYDKGYLDGMKECLELVKFQRNQYDGIEWAIRDIEEKMEEKNHELVN